MQTMRPAGRALASITLALGLVLAGCGDDGGNPLGEARTYYESLDLNSPEAAAQTLVDAFARDDFMTVWLVLDSKTQWRTQGLVNTFRFEKLVRVDAFDDFQDAMRSSLFLGGPAEIESVDSWYLFDTLMMLADANEAFLIDLSGDVTLGVALARAGSTEIPAVVDGVGEVTINLALSPNGRWRVTQVAVPGGDDADVPWSVPNTDE